VRHSHQQANIKGVTMGTETETTAKAEKSEAEESAGERSPLLDAARKVLLAGIGAVGLAQDEAEDFVHRLVERGEIAEKDGRKLINDLMERRKKGTRQAEEELDKRVDALLARMNVPTKADMEALSGKIQALSQKIDELKKSE
jgi:poly(hydroxyalkanoate) granule-associated protein